jgi:hypothetical protein
MSCYFRIPVLLLALVFAASSVVEDKPSGDNTTVQGAPPSSVKWLASQFLAAASICGLLSDMPAPSADKNTPGLEQVIAEAGRAAAAYLNDMERQQLMTMFRLALTDLPIKVAQVR